MSDCISILGSTGSIGMQALEVVRNTGMKVIGLAADTSIDVLYNQILEFKPIAAALRDENKAAILKLMTKGLNVEILAGEEGLNGIAEISGADTVLNSVVGIAGLIPTIKALKSGKNVALANKETLVAGGRVVMEAAKQNNCSIIPVDSEHSAIFQCLMGNKKEEIGRLILTASGGPFRGMKKSELDEVTLEQALKHPNWNMGKKVTIDSATLANKGLEVIEAKWLFDIDIEMIDVVIHPQSIIHSMVEYIDGSVIAQMGAPDMRVPIQFALTYPNRIKNSFNRASIPGCGSLDFEEPDLESFPCLAYAYAAIKEGGTMPAVFNGANEYAVDLFINKKIGYKDISVIIEKCMNKHKSVKNPNINDILQAHRWVGLQRDIL